MCRIRWCGWYSRKHVPIYNCVLRDWLKSKIKLNSIEAGHTNNSRYHSYSSCISWSSITTPRWPTLPFSSAWIWFGWICSSEKYSPAILILSMASTISSLYCWWDTVLWCSMRWWWARADPPRMPSTTNYFSTNTTTSSDMMCSYLCKLQCR